MSLTPTELARRIRHHALTLVEKTRSSHIGSCLSSADILAVLYSRIVRVDPKNPAWPDRDRVIISKGHMAAIVYSVLAESGFFPVSRLDEYAKNGFTLPAHVTRRGVAGVEMSTGSLGHGLPAACGAALWAKRNAKSWRVFVVLSDGECDEGSNWEAILFAHHHKLDNLVVIVDYNHIQSLGQTKDVLVLEPFADKWRSFGWCAAEVDGHDCGRLETALAKLPLEAGRPSCIIADTVKGKGVSFMENTVLWHYHCPDADELQQALRELGPTE